MALGSKPTWRGCQPTQRSKRSLRHSCKPPITMPRLGGPNNSQPTESKIRGQIMRLLACLALHTCECGRIPVYSAADACLPHLLTGAGRSCNSMMSIMESRSARCTRMPRSLCPTYHRARHCASETPRVLRCCQRLIASLAALNVFEGLEGGFGTQIPQHPPRLATVLEKR